jgi:peptide/nickel transport system substrate-binding protein
MKNRFLLTTSLVIASLLTFTTASAKDLRVAYDADPVTLDIHEQLSGGVLQLSHMSFDPLIRWTKELAFEPRLATSFQRLDATTVRFTLRKGVKFHSGNMMTAGAVDAATFSAISLPSSRHSCVVVRINVTVGLCL